MDFKLKLALDPAAALYELRVEATTLLNADQLLSLMDRPEHWARLLYCPVFAEAMRLWQRQQGLSLE